MKIYFYASEKDREQELAGAFLYGMKRAGHTTKKCQTKFNPNDVPDVACMVGVKSLKLWRKAELSGAIPVMFDKGYSRHRKGGCWEYWRISPYTHNPSKTLQIEYPGDRWGKLGFSVEYPRHNPDGHIVIAGSSEKYHNFYGLVNPNEYAQDLVRRIRLVSDAPIIYRPKPSWRGAKEIEGATLSHGNKVRLQTDLEGASKLITHGSNSCFEAALMGVPYAVLGNGVMRGTSMLNRHERFNAIAYHQWALEEMKKGRLNKVWASWF